MVRMLTRLITHLRLIVFFPQQQLKRLKLKRKEVQHLVTRGQQLQAEEGLGETLQQDLHSLENTLSKMEQNMDSQEQNLEVSQV